MFSIAVVGGGATSVTLLTQLVDRLIALDRRGVSVVIIEKSQRVGPGLAYGTSSDSNILNVPYQYMGLVPGDPNHMTLWLTDHKADWQPRYPSYDPAEDAYPPRSLFGLYVEQTYRTALDRAQAHRITVTILHQEVVNICEIKDGLVIRLADGSNLTIDQAILALGNFPPTSYQELHGLPGYVPCAWPDSRVFATVPRDKAVAVLGTKLTAIDVALGLINDGHREKIFLVSPSGVLPKVQQRLSEDGSAHRQAILNRLQLLTCHGDSLRLVDVARIVQDQLATIEPRLTNWRAQVDDGRSAIQWLEHEIRLAEQNQHPWQTILFSLNDDVEEIWNRLPTEDKQKFLEQDYSLWSAYWNPMPIKNAQQVLRHLHSGQLGIIPQLRSVRYDRAAHAFELQNVVDRRWHAPFLVNGTAPGLDLRYIDSKLVKNLLQSGMMIPNCYGGATVEFSTGRLLNHNGQFADRLYLIGSLTQGVHLYTLDMGRMVAHARRVVHSVAVG